MPSPRPLVAALDGLLAALAMTLVMAWQRFYFGIATPPELIGDRIAPLLGVERFLTLLYRVGGYNQLKQLGVGSVLLGQLVVGAGLGLIVARIMSRGSSKNRDERPSRICWRAGRVVLAAVVVLWLISVLLLWPTLGTHYFGLPPGRATAVTFGGLFISYLSYGLVFMLLFVPSILHQQRAARRLGPAQGRRLLLTTGTGVLLTVALGRLLRRLFDIATFSYDGTQYLGPNLEPITPNHRFYIVTKNLIDPEVVANRWRLEITGAVSRPRTYDLQELLAFSPVLQETT